VARLRDALGVELPLARVFEAPTVAGTAAAVEEALATTAEGGTAVPLPALDPLPFTHPETLAPLSFAQERLFFLHRLVPHDIAYNQSFAARLLGPLDGPALVAAFGELVRRHEVLRTTLGRRDGRSVQRVAPAPVPGRAPEQLLRPDLSGLDENRRRRVAQALVDSDARRPFDLTTGPLLRCTLLRLGPEEHVLGMTWHHAVSDGWSVGILYRELAALYGAFADRRAPALAPLPVQYADFAAWQRRWLEGEVLERQVAWWKEHLGDPPPRFSLPLDHPRRAVRGARGALAQLRFPASLTTALGALGRGTGATLAMALLAGFFAVLHRMTGDKRLVVGSPIANRTRPEVEGLIGFFVNTLAMTGDLRGRPTFGELLARVRESSLGAYAHQDLPFERLVEELGLARDLSNHALFQVIFAFQNAPSTSFVLPGLEVEDLDPDLVTTRFDLELHLFPEADGLAGFCAWDPSLLEPTTVERLLRHLRYLLAAAVEAPSRRVEELGWLSPGEEHQLSHEWGRDGNPAPETTLIGAFIDRTLLQPHAVALTWGDPGEHHSSYGALLRQVWQRGQALRAYGVGPEVRVGLLLPRSAEAVVCLLAVLEAGGAFVPLEPELPAARLADLVTEAGIGLLLTRRELLVPEIEGVPVVFVEEEPAAEVAGGLPAAPDNLAYVIFTSGSTGRPKGVAVPHRGVAAHVRWAAELLGIGPGSRSLHLSSLSFDASVLEIFTVEKVQEAAVP
jgi:hypothetical protein